MSDSCALSEAGPRSDIAHVNYMHATYDLLLKMTWYARIAEQFSKCTSTDQVAAILRTQVCTTHGVGIL
jgi:hypothetical protein